VALPIRRRHQIIDCGARGPLQQDQDATLLGLPRRRTRRGYPTWVDRRRVLLGIAAEAFTERLRAGRLCLRCGVLMAVDLRVLAMVFASGLQDCAEVAPSLPRAPSALPAGASEPPEVRPTPPQPPHARSHRQRSPVDCRDIG
jgi:hypothetical protein